MSRVFTVSEVAERLGISTSHVRRCARTYERVYSELGKDARGHRYYTETMVERLEAAHQALSAGRFVSLEAALEAQRDGEPASSKDGLKIGLFGSGSLPVPAKPAESDLSQRVARLEAFLLEDWQRLRAENDDLRRRLAEKQLPKPERPWWRRLIRRSGSDP